MELQIQNVTKRFGEKLAVDNVTLGISPGVSGLLGANGAGKTTLMRMIAGISRPSSGRILCDGVPIDILKERYRDIFGYLPQEFGFYPEFTAKEYLEYVATLKGIPARIAKKKIFELLERLSLADVSGKKIVRMSGGIKRRVGIAQALLNDPMIPILDRRADLIRLNACVSEIFCLNLLATG